MAGDKYRLITRADFDGVVCGGLLIEKNMIGDVAFAEPKEMQDGHVAVTSNDITANLPYAEDVHLCFDHHYSETIRVGEKNNLIIDPNSPSAARVIYDYYGGELEFPGISAELMAAVDKADSADFSEMDILAPKGWMMLNFILDPRTGLGRFGHFSISNEQLMKDMMVYCRHHPVGEILKIPDVEERLHLYMEHEEYFEMQIRKCSKLYAGLVIVDLRDEEIIYAGNRFTVYAILPDCNVSIQITHSANGGQTIFAIGKSIINRTSKINIGGLMLEYGGGGHAAAGTCRIDNDRAADVLEELTSRINAGG
jgi:nanoRNase/pAp phosphatase (c-di-AMP/oligoRNAs hydrolase)